VKGAKVLRGLLPALALAASGLLLGASLWNLDWAIWFRHFWLYYLPPYWHCCVGQCPPDVRCPPPNDLGFWVNVQYFQIAIAFILAMVATYSIGYKVALRRRRA